MKTPRRRQETGKPHQPDPPRREKSTMDAPQEEFIASQAVPSKDRKAAKGTRQCDTRKQSPGYET